ncbi:MAG: glycogen/starch/alpha-glucan phosphorylase, partial [Candidatus Omnitrophota bacterium]
MAKKQNVFSVLHKKMTAESIGLSLQYNRQYFLSKDHYSATVNDNYLSLALSIRDRVTERWIATQQRYHKENARRVYYLSMEFLIGKILDNYAINLGLGRQVKEAVSGLGFDYEQLREQEPDAGLGNGGLGRLAACYLDSMATLGVPAHGYGMRFDFGIFRQRIQDGSQIELPDEWLKHGSPWEFARPEYAVRVRFFGRQEMSRDPDGAPHYRWVDTEDVVAEPYDIAIPGYKNNVVNTLRLWSAKSTEDFDFEYFNSGDYERAVHRKILSENISRVLYPNDTFHLGKELRLKQQYFFTAASIFDIIRRFHAENTDPRQLPEKICIQLNDTHPSLAIVELMRVLIDNYGLSWEYERAPICIF